MIFGLTLLKVLILSIQNMKQVKDFFLFFVLVALAFFAIGCEPQSDAVKDAVDSAVTTPYRVVATVGMITDVVRNVVGDYAEVEGIIGEGVDPHLYKPTRTDVVKLNEADLVFYNGLLLEGKMSDILVRVATSGKPVRAVTEAILEDADYLLGKEDDGEYTDPHIWMDVKGWMTGVG